MDNLPNLAMNNYAISKQLPTSSARNKLVGALIVVSCILFVALVAVLIYFLTIKTSAGQTSATCKTEPGVTCTQSGLTCDCTADPVQCKAETGVTCIKTGSVCDCTADPVQCKAEAGVTCTQTGSVCDCTADAAPTTCKTEPGVTCTKTGSVCDCTADPVAPTAPTVHGVTCSLDGKAYTCHPDCAQLVLTAAPGCTANYNPTSQLCELSCANKPCTTAQFAVTDSKTWTAVDSTGACKGTVFLGSSNEYCQSVPQLSNGLYTNYAKVAGFPNMSHFLNDGQNALAGKTQMTDRSNPWFNVNNFCHLAQNCMGLDVFYDQVAQQSYYVPCQFNPENQSTNQISSSKLTNTPFIVPVEHFGAVVLKTVNSANSNSAKRATKKVPGW